MKRNIHCLELLKVIYILLLGMPVQLDTIVVSSQESIQSCLY